jgi:hypothetical protein
VLNTTDFLAIAASLTARTHHPQVRLAKYRVGSSKSFRKTSEPSNFSVERSRPAFDPESSDDSAGQDLSGYRLLRCQRLMHLPLEQGICSIDRFPEPLGQNWIFLATTPRTIELIGRRANIIERVTAGRHDPQRSCTSDATC